MAEERIERDYCNKHSIKDAVTCPICGEYMSVDEDGYFCTECDKLEELWDER